LRIVLRPALRILLRFQLRPLLWAVRRPVLWPGLRALMWALLRIGLRLLVRAFLRRRLRRLARRLLWLALLPLLRGRGMWQLRGLRPLFVFVLWRKPLLFSLRNVLAELRTGQRLCVRRGGRLCRCLSRLQLWNPLRWGLRRDVRRAGVCVSPIDGRSLRSVRFFIADL
jgi:hypothetical protein